MEVNKGRFDKPGYNYAEILSFVIFFFESSPTVKIKVNWLCHDLIVVRSSMKLLV